MSVAPLMAGTRGGSPLAVVTGAIIRGAGGPSAESLGNDGSATHASGPGAGALSTAVTPLGDTLPVVWASDVFVEALGFDDSL
jgi:hypothetical protein